MRVIIGLGNPENNYKGTRHNIGFEAVNKLAYDHGIKLNKAKFRAHLGEGRIGDTKALLVKPQTYMNLSGEAVRDILHFYKLMPTQIIVLSDDAALPLGHIRVRERGSAGGQNGLKSVIYQLETDAFLRVRIGIGEKPPGYDLGDYVLSRFKPHEMEAMIAGVTKATEAVELILKCGAQDAMNRYNTKSTRQTEPAKETLT